MGNQETGKAKRKERSVEEGRRGNGGRREGKRERTRRKWSGGNGRERGKWRTKRTSRVDVEIVGGKRKRGREEEKEEGESGSIQGEGLKNTPVREIISFDMKRVPGTKRRRDGCKIS